MSLKNKIILVTGGAGFIGSNLVDRLIQEEPAKIIVASNFFLGKYRNLSEAKKRFSALEIVRCDVSDPLEMEDLFNDYNFDVVFNLAVIPLPTSLVKPELYTRKNIDMTINICKGLRLGKFKTLVQFSSSEAPGSLKIAPMSEDHPMDPETPYAAAKAATDHIALSYHHTYGCDVVVVRPFNQYGPRQNALKYAGIIPLTVGRMMRGEDVILFGTGNQTRDFLYVSDTVDAVVEAYDNLKTRGKVVNIASGKEVSMKQVVDAIGSLMGYNKPYVYKETRIGDVSRHLADISRAKELMGWEPKVSFDEGIRKTVEWYTSHPEVFKNDS
jgi:UDP-glucose 4-epimerase